MEHSPVLDHAERPNKVTETCSTWNMLKVPRR